MSKQKEEKNLTPQSEEEIAAAETEIETETAAESDAVISEEASKKKSKKERTPEEEKERALNRVKRLKKMKYGSLATVITVVVIAIVVMANVVCGVMDKRFNWNIDLTSSGLYEISEETITYLNQLDTDIDIVVMAEESYFLENSKLKVLAETLTRFRTESNGHISVSYVDMTKNPETVKKYTEKYNGDFAQGDVVVASDTLQRVVAFSDLIANEQSIDYATYQYVNNYTFKGEKSLLSAIMGVTDLNPVNVAVLSKAGAGFIYYQNESYSFQGMMELLEKNNYQYTEVDLAMEALDPAVYQIAVLCAPNNDLTEAQIQKINDFLYNNGEYGRQLIYFASIYQKETPHLDSFLETWGLAVDDHVIYEGDTASAQYVQTALGMLQQIPVATLQFTDYSSALATDKLPLVAPLCRPIECLFETNSGRTTKPLLTTAETAFLYPLTGSEEFDESTAETGSFNLAVAATQNFNVDNEQRTSTLIAFGSAWLLDYYVTQTSAYNNTDYFVTIVNALAGKENVITVADKSLNATAITITEAQLAMLRTVVIFIIPLIVAVLGVVVYIRRRNR